MFTDILFFYVVMKETDVLMKLLGFRVAHLFFIICVYITSSASSAYAGVVSTCLGETRDSFSVKDFLNRKIAQVKLVELGSMGVKVQPVCFFNQRNSEYVLKQELIEALSFILDDLDIIPDWFRESDILAALAVLTLNNYSNFQTVSTLTANSIYYDDSKDSVTIVLLGENTSGQAMTANITFLAPPSSQSQYDHVSFTFQLSSTDLTTTYTVSYDDAQDASLGMSSSDSQLDDANGAQGDSELIPDSGSQDVKNNSQSSTTDLDIQTSTIQGSSEQQNSQDHYLLLLMRKAGDFILQFSVYAKADF